MDPRPTFVLTGCGLFLLIITGLHVLRGDVPPLTSGISRYAGAQTLLPATVAFLALAGSAAVLGQMAPRTPARRALLIASSGLLLVVMTPIGYPNPPVVVTALHTGGGLAFYLGALVAMFTPGPAATNMWFGRSTLALLALFFAGAAGAPALNEVDGLLQRLVFAAIVIWMTRTALGSGVR